MVLFKTALCIKQVIRVNNNSLTTLLTETERSDRDSLNTISLDGSGWEQNIFVIFQDLINVIGVSVTWNQTSLQDLNSTVQHPSTSSTLWMTSQVLLENTKDWVTWSSTQVAHHSINSSRFIFIVSLGGGTVERTNIQIINSQTESGQ
ncbi:unnamed protein product [Ambrosiozyma monospora]|uniref:Unnamed protein product n=1 Tax=Ambrosiozyma monospora TaxID=43982 RepID=A0ACB5U8A6_AMBMO|nr:unnamed protein product [Ambrosiozyma monospora]